MERARRDGVQMALLAIDLDGFKKVNDTLGHHVGDHLLREVAALFGQCVRRIDTLARTGGDEFCIVLEGPIGRADALRVATALSRRLDAPLDVDGQPVLVGASIGLAMFPDDASSVETLCVLADQRMYEAKHSLGPDRSSGESRRFESGRAPPASEGPRPEHRRTSRRQSRGRRSLAQRIG